MYMKKQSLEINSWGLDIDIGGIHNCVIKFIIGISEQTINYVITRNPRNWPVYSATAMLQLKLRDMVIIIYGDRVNWSNLEMSNNVVIIWGVR